MNAIAILMTTPTPIPVTATPGTPKVMVPSGPVMTGQVTVAGTLLSATLLAALLAALVNIIIARRKSREEERARLRDRFAHAYGAYAEYCEFAYAVRRRRHDDVAAERVRISEAMRAVQGELHQHEAWVKLESPAIGVAYSSLIQEMRTVAGAAIRQGWNDPPIAEDTQVNISQSLVDLSTLKPYETAYLDAVASYLKALTPWWAK